MSKTITGKKMSVEFIDDTHCAVTNLANSKTMKLQGREAILMMSLANNGNEIVPEELISLAIKYKKPLPPVGKNLRQWIDSATTNN